MSDGVFRGYPPSQSEPRGHNNPVGEPQPSEQNAIHEKQTEIRQEGQVIEPQPADSTATTYVGEPHNEDCFRVVRSSKYMEIPCTRNEYQRYKVKVPKQVHEKVPRRVRYIDYETREKSLPYPVKRCETAYREESQEYTVKVPKKVTRMVKVRKRVPKTVYVDIITEEPREVTIMVCETRNRQVKVPYTKEIIDQKYVKVKESVPVTKCRTEYDTIPRTVYEESWRTKMVPVTKIVHKEIPVYSVVRNDDCENCAQVEFNAPSHTPVEHPSKIISEPAYNDHVNSHIDTYPPYVETYQEPESTHNVGPNYEQTAPAVQNNEPVHVEESYEPAPLRQEMVTNHSQTAPVTDEREIQDDGKVEKWVETKYSAPAEYDANKDGVLDANEREAARADGKLHVDSISVVENPEEGGAVIEQLTSQPRRKARRRRKRKDGGGRRRRSRRK